MKILEVKDLRKIYGKGETLVKALDGVSFSVEKGEFLAVVGTSGSGKSTLLHMMGGLDIPTGGKVLIDGKDLSSMITHNEEIAQTADRILHIEDGKLVKGSDDYGIGE